MIQNLHTHTSFCDGKNSAEEMVQAAIAKGFTSLGFSGHAPIGVDNQWCMTEEKVTPYIEEIARLKTVYKDQITLYTGLEMDGVFPMDTTPFDYVIISTHCFWKNGKLLSVDHTKEIFRHDIEEHYSGNVREYLYDYYDHVVKSVKYGDILGHFDLITKFNEGNIFFREDDPQYLDLARQALTACLEEDILVEMNTGAIQRGYRKMPYPTIPLLSTIREKGKGIILTTDAHEVSGLDFYAKEGVELLRGNGFTTQWQLTNKGFTVVPL